MTYTEVTAVVPVETLGVDVLDVVGVVLVVWLVVVWLELI